MKFKQGSRRKASDYEKELVQYWKENKTFEKSVEMRPKDNSYVFYDGPPFITGVPHHGTLLSSVVKDAVPRYWTMKGKRVERVWGWDCHGLPAEVFTEKKLGIKDRRDIGTKISLEEYVQTCRANMVQTGSEWEDVIDRIGRWVDFKGAYTTMDKDYMESVWWAFKKLYEAGKIYEGEKVLLYCTRDATPISKAEVAMDNSYQDVTDPSVYVKFELIDWADKKAGPVYLLAWTTTPWTLPSNTAIAVNQDLEYAEVEVGDERFILAKDLVATVLTDEKHKPIEYKIVKTFKGKELLGKSYVPLFGEVGKNAHKVWHADFVHAEEGTGIAHESPAYGEEDYTLSKQCDFPMKLDTDENGMYTDGEWKGSLVWDVNKEIAKTLHERGIVWKITYIQHSYPHCHRCGTKLMYRAHPSWFMNIGDQREKMLEENGGVNWFPEHIKEGRFAQTVLTAPDWNISRDRFWATAMPVWKGVDKSGKEHIKVVGSYEELKELSGKELDDYHRPWIDEITFTIDDVEYRRIEKVLDCWFESGSMPFAQFHYPFENKEKFELAFPGDFISEYTGQVRAWFYYLHAVSTGLFDQKAFKNVIVTGVVAGNDGRKMSKNFGNYTDPNELMNEFSADSLRFLLLSSPLLSGEDFTLVNKDVSDVHRKLMMIWNMYDFFTLYADVDGWEWDGSLEDPSEQLTNPLDQWVISRLHQLTQHVDEQMEHYDIPNALDPIIAFVDDASNWYVRRSRKRFWKTTNDKDKTQAYQTLHYVLIRLALVMAPFTPFLAEELFRQLTGKESVHLEDWPATGHINELVLGEMATIRELITIGLAQRATAGIKTRQPLASASVVLPFSITDADKSELYTLMTEELNVKKLDCSTGVTAALQIDTAITPTLKREGYVRDVIRQIQSTRKQAGLEVDDRIHLSLETKDKELDKAIEEHLEVIKSETLVSKLEKTVIDGFETEVVVDNRPMKITLKATK